MFNNEIILKIFGVYEKEDILGRYEIISQDRDNETRRVVDLILANTLRSRELRFP